MFSAHDAPLAFFPMLLMSSVLAGSRVRKRQKTSRGRLQRPSSSSALPEQPHVLESLPRRSDDSAHEAGPARFSNSVQTSSRSQDDGQWEDESLLALFLRSCSFGVIDLVPFATFELGSRRECVEI